MSDDEVIKFEITDHDLETEFAPRRGRAKKEQQIYGVWAADSDDEENEDVVRSRVRKAKDYAAPIGFVAGGVQQAGKKKERQSVQQASSSPSVSHTIPDSSSEDERPSTPAETETAGIRRRGQGMRGPTLENNLGTWEKHTKGIGAKLLLQMGYKPGKGLGKDLQGISAPVEATLRKGRGAIGAYGPEKAALKAKREAEKLKALKESEENSEAVKEKSYHWRKSHKGRYFYRDAADVIQEGKPSIHMGASSELARVPVIDMTGKEKRVLSGYHALRSVAPRFEHEPRRKCTNFSIPELTHNLQLTVECCEQDIIENARELRTAEDELVAVERDLREQERQLEEEDSIIELVEDILKQVERLDTPDLTLDEAYNTFKEILSSHPLEYDMFGLGLVACDIVSPLLTERLSAWDPLQAPDEHVEEFSRWRALVPEEAYNTMLWNHFIPAIKKASELWNPRVPEPMLRAVTAWRPACPAWLVRECAARCAAPRVLSAVRVWDPTCDTQPLHQWVLPWHPLAGQVLATTVYPLIRSRLATALEVWHPADTSALPLLSAWREAWGSALTALIQQHIIPKLETCLQQAPVELVGRENTAWSWCADWTELAGAAAVGAVAARALLPRWLSALAAWLNTNPPHATVLASYTNMKKMFPEEVLKEPAVRDSFRKALDMMNRSADLSMETDAPQPPPPPHLSPERTDISRVAEVIGSINQQKSFSELLEARCAERGISYLPMPGRSREGRPLYKIGNSLQCYVIRNVVMYSGDIGRTFVPISLDKLLHIADN